MPDNHVKWQRIGFGVLTLILAAAFLWALFLSRNLNDISFQEGPCGFSQTFHLYCPGCGGTRALKYLLEGHIVDSFLANPIPIYAIVLLLRIWTALLHNIVHSAFSKDEWKILYQREMWGILVVVIGVFVLRNLALVFLKWDFLGDMAGYW